MASATSKLLVTDIAAENIDRLPSNYIRPEGDRPDLSQVVTLDSESIPLVDLQGLHGPDRGEIVRHIDYACREYGFFQIKNHGIEERIVNGMLGMGKEFFRLPESERLKNYSEDIKKSTRLYTSHNLQPENVYNWRDFLRIHCHPLEEFVHDWPTNPPNFRDVVSEYCLRIRKLVLELLEAISESLGLEKDYIVNNLGRHKQLMAINYYPPCPQPELTYGLPSHTDSSLITILLPDDVPGLQVLKDGKWVAVNPIPDTFIVNVGDIMPVVSNNRYKSVLHRAVVNGDRERMSIPTFYSPSPDAIVRPAAKLVEDEDQAAYRPFTFGEFFSNFSDGDLRTVGGRDVFTVTSAP